MAANILAIYPFKPTWETPQGRATYSVGPYWVETTEDSPPPTLIEVNKMYNPPTVTPYVAKAEVVDRLTDEQLEKLIAGMTARQRELWYMRTQIATDDQAMIQALRSAGADPNIILKADKPKEVQP